MSNYLSAFVEHVVWYVVSHLKAPSVKIVPLHNSFMLHYNTLDSEARKHSKNSAGHVIASFSSLNLASLEYLVLVPDFVWLCFCMFLKFHCVAVGCYYKRTIAKVATISFCLILALFTARLYGMLNGDRFVRAEHWNIWDSQNMLRCFWPCWTSCWTKTKLGKKHKSQLPFQIIPIETQTSTHRLGTSPHHPWSHLPLSSVQRCSKVFSETIHLWKTSPKTETEKLKGNNNQFRNKRNV